MQWCLCPQSNSDMTRDTIFLPVQGEVNLGRTLLRVRCRFLTALTFYTEENKRVFNKLQVLPKLFSLHHPVTKHQVGNTKNNK